MDLLIEVRMNWKGMKLEWEDKIYSKKEIEQIFDGIKNTYLK